MSSYWIYFSDFCVVYVYAASLNFSIIGDTLSWWRIWKEAFEWFQYYQYRLRANVHGTTTIQPNDRIARSSLSQQCNRFMILLLPLYRRAFQSEYNFPYLCVCNTRKNDPNQTSPHPPCRSCPMILPCWIVFDTIHRLVSDTAWPQLSCVEKEYKTRAFGKS